MPIQRITCFKIKNETDIQGILDQYEHLSKTNQKDGKPYILETSAHKAIDDPRNSGYNLVAVTKYASMEDVKYYDEECEAHKQLKAFATGKLEGPPLAFHLEV
ncbi:hypothetical protein LTR35_014408 [Friedmanniomyces endolithicus]|uniref:Stress-response A/B barrel domain-containing protein n=1 Tax=Friedmanniomyces endolithicus TaxID=329885 RepID=A0AAN6FAQ5_9PEZI|nr:hypothetical protein LTR35_014408 [Friedmanniomyces endolithicus]KAK0279350.1 hypothetical protein LTS00_013455 [Friedmanniomyces endolithicus]KAK0312396.1 hypothetical protein LTR82_013866 [Friedmanniomyces endolithicus]KAK0988694.1 hypothetical protein LTR54_012654 [Friedmanniomyces endolithicus]